MIKGIGTDLVEIKRIEKSLKRTPSIVDKILSTKEKNHFEQLPENQKINYVAKRFAAKEAFAKATGQGIRDEIQMRYISVLNDELGNPYFEFLGGIKGWLDNQNTAQVSVSLSDTAEHALAFVILS